MTDAPNPSPAPPAAIAARLLGHLDVHDSLIHLADDERSAEEIAEALQAFMPDAEVLLLPPWDCLPYDRVHPTRECMGKRMAALRSMHRATRDRRVIVTSVEAALQSVPPLIDRGFTSLSKGDSFDRDAFRNFSARTGYVIDDRVDEAGEMSLLGDVVDVFPAAANQPVRIMLGPDGRIASLKSYDPLTQRTIEELSTIDIGPASELILDYDNAEGPAPRKSSMEQQLLARYGDLATIFDIAVDAAISFAEGLELRLEHALAIIADARSGRADGPAQESETDRYYLDRHRWASALRKRQTIAIPVSDLASPPIFSRLQRPGKSLGEFVDKECEMGRRIVIAGSEGQLDRASRLLARHTKLKPTDVVDWSEIVSASKGELLMGPFVLSHGYIDTSSGISVIAAADIFGSRPAVSVTAAHNLLEGEPELRIGDVVLHEDHGLGVLRALETVEVDGVERNTARLEYHGAASQLVPVEEFGRVWRYGASAETVSLDKLNGTGWAERRKKVLAEVKRIARHLVDTARARAEGNGRIIKPPRAEYARFEARFPYTETDDQRAAIAAVLADLESGVAMNRLICGDVGFGKTEIALRAAAAVALCGMQVAIVAPTTVLARQHYQTFKRRFEGTGIAVGHLSRLTGSAEAKSVKERLRTGDIGVVVATQAVVSSTVAFAELGLLVIDEEHRFGTKLKQKLRAMAPHLHTLSMSATPIPRTLLSAMSGVQDVSVLSSAPARRRPIRTHLAPFDAASAKTALLREQRRGGQSFFVVPRIEDIDTVAGQLARLVPELSLAVAHGEMKSQALDDVMVDFADGVGDVLLATSIIESGLDVPRANTMLVWRSDRFGLAQLHQLRGRVGRGRGQGVAYLFTEPDADVPEETRSRLSTLVALDRLGAGLAISSRDLDLRGGGDLIGAEQAGHMRVLGVGLYQRLLARAVLVARGEPDIYRRPASINMGPAGSFPSSYIPDAGVRLNLYSRLLRTTTQGEIAGLVDEIVDRFGALPAEVELLVEAVRLALAAAAIGIAQIDAGPTAIGIRFSARRSPADWQRLARLEGMTRKANRLIVDRPTEPGAGRATAIGDVIAILADR